MSKGLAAAASLAVLLGSGCSAHTAQAPPPAIAVRVAAVRPERFASVTEFAGTLTSAHSVTLGAVSAGRIVSVAVRLGDRVHAGQTIAQVDATAYGAQLAGARAGATAAADGQRAAAAQLAQAQSRFWLAQTTARRMATLYAQGAISRQQQDETQAGLAAAGAGVEQAQAGLDAARGVAVQARAGVTAAAVPLQNARITAPFDGVITQKFVEPGAVVGPGSPVAALEDTGDLELDVALPEDQVAALRVGMPLSVRVDALAGATVAARLRALVPSENPALRSVTLRVSIAAQPGLLPGMFARVSVLGLSERTIGVPLSALATRAGQAGVFVVRSGTASFVPVQAGVVAGGFVEVRGLSDGTRVAVGNVAQLTDGAAVSVVHP